MISPWKASGFWPSFDRPFPVPSTLVTDDPTSKVCFNTDWSPFILGALNVLRRPETWVGTPAEIASVMEQVAFIQGELGGDDPCSPCPNWYLAQADGGVLDCGASTVDYETFAGDGTCPSVPFVTVGTAYLPVGGASQCHLRGKSGMTTGVGGNVKHVHCAQLGNVVGNTFNVQWVDCLGTTHSELVAGNRVFIEDIEAKEICITALDKFLFVVETEGQYLCTPA